MITSFLDQMDEYAKEGASERSNGYVTRVTLTFGIHTGLNAEGFAEKGEPFDYKASFVEINNDRTKADAVKESKKIANSYNSNLVPKFCARVWSSRKDVLGFDATENSDKDYYKDDLVYAPDRIQIDGEYKNIPEGYDAMSKSLREYADKGMIEVGKPFWAHVITYPVAHNGKYVKRHDGSTLTVPYFLKVFKNKQEATRYQAKLDAGEIELPKWSINAENAEGSTQAVNITLSATAQADYTPASFLKTFPTIVKAIEKNVANGDDVNDAMVKAGNVFACEYSDIMEVLALETEESESYRTRIFGSDEEPI